MVGAAIPGIVVLYIQCFNCNIMWGGLTSIFHSAICVFLKLIQELFEHNYNHSFEFLVWNFICSMLTRCLVILRRNRIALLFHVSYVFMSSLVHLELSHKVQSQVFFPQKCSQCSRGTRSQHSCGLSFLLKTTTKGTRLNSLYSTESRILLAGSSLTSLSIPS